MINMIVEDLRAEIAELYRRVSRSHTRTSAANILEQSVVISGMSHSLLEAVRDAELIQEERNK